MTADAMDQLRIAIARRAVGERDAVRLVGEVSATLTPVEIARKTGLALPEVEDLIARSDTIPPVKDGFSGADPYEIIQRYVVGELDRAQLLDELGRWEYTPEVYGEWEGYFPGDWQKYVEEALREGLIDDSLYMAASAARRSGGRSSGA